MKKRIVIKLGGASLQDPSTLDELVLAVRNFRRRGLEVILVHGGGPAINEELNKLGIKWQFINGQRQTTPEMMSIIKQVLESKVNTMIVDHLQSNGIMAKKISAADEKILYCRPLTPELIQVGEVIGVETQAIETTLGKKLVPVIAPVGFGEGGINYNINADWAASKLAIALRAEKLVFLTDQNGVLDENKKLIKVASPGAILSMIQSQIISGGMRTKTLAMLSALESGVEKIQVLNARFASQLGTKMKTGTVLKNLNIKGVIHEYAI